VDVVEAALACGNTCTMPFAIFQQVVKHPLIEIGVKKFLTDWNAQVQKSSSVGEGIRS
jgi:transaldolase